MLILAIALYYLGNYVVRRLSSSKESENVQEASIMSTEVEKVDSTSEEMNERVILKRRYSNDSLEGESRTRVTFSPPVFLQRYLAVQKILSDPQYEGGKHKKIVDFGCSELGLVVYLKTLVGVEEILFVDVDRDTLERFSCKAQPLNADYLHRRTTPLCLRVLEGSVNDHDKILENVDAVICIELIEHLYPEDLTNFPFSIFGFINPKLAIITTPNADFNVLFNSPGFRHWDHKFEWTRSQFEDWANNITLRYPEYEVTFHGIGNGPPNTEHLGACTQMAIFRKVIDLNQPKIPGFEGLLKTVNEFEYPFDIDTRSDEEKILEDAIYYIRKFSFSAAEYEEEVPLRLVMSMLKFPISETDLREILQNNQWSVIQRGNEFVVLVPPPTQLSDLSLNEENFLNDIDDYDNDYDSDNIYGRDPGPPPDYFFPRNEEYRDIDEGNEELWDEPNITVRREENEVPDGGNDAWNEMPENEINRVEEEHMSNSGIRNIENESQDGGHDAWGDLPENQNEILDEDNEDSEEYANTTSSIFADDINLDDVETESRSSEIANSPRDESIILSSFSETRDSENSEVTRDSYPLTQNNLSINSNVVDSNNSVLFSESRVNSNFENSEYINTSTLLVEASQVNVQSEDLSDSMVASAGSLIDEATTKLNIENDTATQIINDNRTFDEPKDASSPYVPSNKRIRIDHQEAEPLNSDNNAERTNGSSNNVLRNNDSKDDLNSCSNEVSECFPQSNKIESPENARHYTGTIPKSCKRKISDIEVNAQEATKLEKISPDTPGSIAVSCSPEVMDSGYPNSTSPPDLSPEHDLSSIAQDKTSDSESPSIEDAPRVGLFEIEIQNRDLDNNNLDGEGNNLEAEEDRHGNDLRPIINVLENDLENENDIYDARNGFPAWLLRIH